MIFDKFTHQLSAHIIQGLGNIRNPPAFDTISNIQSFILRYF